jgi:hypothetical protein
MCQRLPQGRLSAVRRRFSESKDEAVLVRPGGKETDMDPSVNASSISAHTTQQDTSVATRAKAVWDEYIRMRAAQLAEQGASVNPSSSLCASLTTTEAPSSSEMSWLEHKRLELEGGPAGDHDTPYRFALPISLKERLDWIHLQRRVQAGEFPA